jgi:hypothetical protein
MEFKVFKLRLTDYGFSLKKVGDSGVLLTTDLDIRNSELTPQEIFALEYAKRFDATAVYFRHFDDGRNAIAQAYIFDNTRKRLSEENLTELHKKLWSSCAVPLYIIIEETQVKIFDAREPVKEVNSKLSASPFDVFKTAADVKRKLEDLLNTGVFWEAQTTKNRFDFASSAYTDLILGLKRLHVDFEKESGIPGHIITRLLVQCLLIKYLEERTDEANDEETRLIAKNFFRKKGWGADDFCGVIRNGYLLQLLDRLKVQFNGKVFEWSEETPDDLETREYISSSKIKLLADYLDGNVKNDQYVIWRLYSFSYLPVELISSVYEELLSGGKKDMVYTPDVVAGTLIDECMPLDVPKANFKLIDVSCGSGIFLVKGFKRVVQWWRLQNRNANGDLPHPDREQLKDLLSNSIYGIDIQHEATLLTIFSLALALCDELNPKEIWTNLRFRNLSANNILSKDFFQYLTEKPSADFDLVIGNPPFNPPMPFEKSNHKYLKHIKEKFGYKPTIKVPDYNIALTMLVESFNLLKQNGQLCLIQPSGPLLYQHDAEFKKEIFGKYNFQQVIDFTFLVDKLWSKATVSTAAVFIQKSLPDVAHIAHIVLHRTKTNLNKLYFEIDHYDFHYVSKYEAVSNPFVWKANLIGGSRLVQFVKRLSQLRTLGDFIEFKEGHRWVANEGFIEKGEYKRKAPFITGKPHIPNKFFTEEGVIASKIQVCEIEHFHSTGDPRIYKPPHILLKENIGENKLQVDYLNSYLTFRANIIGFHAPKNQEDELKRLYSYFQEHGDLIRAYLIAISSQLVIGLNTAVLKNDFMQCPYPENLKDLKISTLEKKLIKEVLEHYRNATQKNKLEERIADEYQIRGDYVKTFCGVLNSVYNDGSKQFALSKLVETEIYYAIQFDYTKKELKVVLEKDNNWEKHFKELIQDNQHRNGHIKTQRILKLYSKDKIAFVKPKNLRYWLNINAVRDADEAIDDYIKAGF